MPPNVKKSDFARAYNGYRSGIIDGDFTVTAPYGRVAKSTMTAPKTSSAKRTTTKSARQMSASPRGRPRSAA